MYSAAGVERGAYSRNAASTVVAQREASLAALHPLSLSFALSYSSFIRTLGLTPSHLLSISVLPKESYVRAKRD